VEELIALGIAIRSGVLTLCEHHGKVFFDAERDPAPAFELAQELLNARAPVLDAFDGDPHAIMDLLTLTIGNAPGRCAACALGEGGFDPESAGREGNPAQGRHGPQLSPRG
jgi:hypothetical protein